MKTAVRLVSGLFVAAVAVCLAIPARADTLQVSLFAGSTTLPTCVDNTACDTNPAAGIIILPNMTVNGVELNDFTVTSTGTAGNLTKFNSLTLSGSIINTNPSGFATIFGVVADRNYASLPLVPTNNTRVSLSGTWVRPGGVPTQGSFGFRMWNDRTNTQWGSTISNNPANTAAAGIVMNWSCIDSDTGAASSPGGKCSLPNSGSPSVISNSTNTAPFALVLAESIRVAGGSSLLDFRQSISTESVIPEPSTFSLMLLGFAGIGFVGYRRTRRAKPQVA